jgi:hypothetical protein
MIQFEEKVYEIREYSTFPVKGYFADKLVKTYKKQAEALQESVDLNRVSDNKRYYAIDNPHEEIVVKPKMKKRLYEQYGLV